MFLESLADSTDLDLKTCYSARKKTKKRKEKELLTWCDGAIVQFIDISYKHYTARYRRFIDTVDTLLRFANYWIICLLVIILITSNFLTNCN